MTLLAQIDRDQKKHREKMRLQTRAQLRAALHKLLPGQNVVVFGSLVKSSQFNESSDIDLALENEPAAMTIHRLSSLLGEDLGRRVDVVLLTECRFRERILREGEKWTLPD